MGKRAKRIGALLLALTLVWQPSWSNAAPYVVQAEENEEIAQETADGQQENAEENNAAQVQEQQEEAERIAQAQAQQEEAERIKEQQKAEQEKDQREAELRKEQAEAQADEKQSGPATEISAEEFKGIRVAGMEINGNDHEIQAGESFDVLLTLENTLDEDVSVLPGVVWQNEDMEVGYMHQAAEETLLQSGTEKIVTITVDVPVYEKAASWELYMVSCDIWYTDGEWVTSLSYDPNLDSFYWLDEMVTGEVVYNYEGEIDYRVINEGESDQEDPSVTKVTFEGGAVETTTGTLEDLTVQVYYKEDVAGVSWINLAFRNGDDEYDREEFHLNEGSAEQGEYIGEGVIEISSKQLRTYGGKYTLESVSIGDYAGNSVWYQLNEDGELTVDGDPDSEPAFDRVSYTVDHKSNLPYVLIEELKLTDSDGNPVDKDHIVAGDSLNFAATLINKTDEYVEISGNAEWEKADDSSRTFYNYSPENLSLQPGESGTLIIPVANSKYTAEAMWKLSYFSYNLSSADGSNTAYVTYTPESEDNDAEYYYSIEDGEWVYLPVEDTYLYTGEADYTVTEAPNPDENAPEIEKITIMDDSAVSGEIGNFDNLKVKVHYSEDISGIENINLTFRTDSGVDEYLSFNGQETEESVYVGSAVMELSSTQLRNIGDTYKLVYADIYDYAGNHRAYEAVDGVMREFDSEDRGFEQPYYSVVWKTKLEGVMFAGMQMWMARENR